MNLVRIASADVYQARAVRRGRATRAPGSRVVTIAVHRPSGRVVYEVLEPGLVRLGPSVSAYLKLGYSVEELAS